MNLLASLTSQKQQRSMRHLLLVLLCTCTILTSCAFVRGNAGQEFGKEETNVITALQKGTTTRSEVASTLGAPDEIIAAVGREIFHYRRYDAKLGLILFLSRLNVASDNLYILFDKEGIVEEVIFGKRTDDLEFQVWPFGE